MRRAHGIREKIPGRLLGYDISRPAIQIASENAKLAGLERHVRFMRGRRAEVEPAWESGGYRFQSALRRADGRGGGAAIVIQRFRGCTETAVCGVYGVSVHRQSAVGKIGWAADSETVYTIQWTD